MKTSVESTNVAMPSVAEIIIVAKILIFATLGIASLYVFFLITVEE